jgi:hypothetical protein
MSVKVRLEDGSMEKFSKSNIIESLETIGLDHKSAKKIANEIEKHKGISEHEIKIKIFQILDSMDSEIADKYMKTKKVFVKSESMPVEGSVLIPEFLMDYLQLRYGDNIDLFHNEKSCILRSYGMKDIYHHQEHNTIFLSERDMIKMDIKENHQVAICKHEP